MKYQDVDGEWDTDGFQIRELFHPKLIPAWLVGIGFWSAVILKFIGVVACPWKLIFWRAFIAIVIVTLLVCLCEEKQVPPTVDKAG